MELVEKQPAGPIPPEMQLIERNLHALMNMREALTRNSRKITVEDSQVFEQDLQSIILDFERLQEFFIGSKRNINVMDGFKSILELLNSALIEMQSVAILLNEPDVNTRLGFLNKVKSCRDYLTQALDMISFLMRSLSTSSPPIENNGDSPSTPPQPSRPSTPGTSRAFVEPELPELDDSALFSRLSPSSRQSLNAADGIRMALKQHEIHMEHLMAGLLAKRGGPAEELLGKANIDTT